MVLFLPFILLSSAGPVFGNEFYGMLNYVYEKW